LRTGAISLDLSALVEQIQTLARDPPSSDENLAWLETDPTPAAVLVPIVQAREPAVLLTKRTPHLNAHAGQVSFPGGRIDASDADPEAAALREAEEEIGLPPSAVCLLGRLRKHITSTGFCITPVVGVIPPGLPLRPSPEEVEALFTLPLAVLLDPSCPKREKAFLRGRWREYWVWPHPEFHIWGATAAILLQLAALLRQQAHK